MDKKISEGEWDSFIKPPGMKDPDRFTRMFKSESIPLIAGD